MFCFWVQIDICVIKLFQLLNLFANAVGESDMTFLCTEAGKAPNDVLTKARYAIDQAGGKLAGLVLTDVGPEQAEEDVKINAAIVKA